MLHTYKFFKEVFAFCMCTYKNSLRDNTNRGPVAQHSRNLDCQGDFEGVAKHGFD